MGCLQARPGASTPAADKGKPLRAVPPVVFSPELLGSSEGRHRVCAATAYTVACTVTHLQHVTFCVVAQTLTVAYAAVRSILAWATVNTSSAHSSSIIMSRYQHKH